MVPVPSVCAGVVTAGPVVPVAGAPLVVVAVPADNAPVAPPVVAVVLPVADDVETVEPVRKQPKYSDNPTTLDDKLRFRVRLDRCDTTVACRLFGELHVDARLGYKRLQALIVRSVLGLLNLARTLRRPARLHSRPPIRCVALASRRVSVRSTLSCWCRNVPSKYVELSLFFIDTDATTLYRCRSARKCSNKHLCGAVLCRADMPNTLATHRLS